MKRKEYHPVDFPEKTENYSWKIFHIGIVLLITLFSYLNIFRNTFVWDDTTFITNWYAIRHWNIISFFQGALPVGHEGVWRPLRTVFYAVNYHLWKVNPFGYHLQAIVIHVLSTALVYFITKKLTNNKIIALGTSLLFGIHPVHTESVTFMTASFDMYASLFTLGAIAVFLVALERRSIAFRILSLILALSAFLSGEFALALPLLIAGILWFKRSEMSKKQIAIDILTHFSLLWLYVLGRFIIFHVALRQMTIGDPSIVWILMLRGLTRYITVLTIPWKLNVIYQVTPEKIPVNLLPGIPNWIMLINFPVIIAILFIGVSAILLWKLRKSEPLIVFCIVWFYLTLLPVSNIIPANAAIAERYLYLPSFAWCLSVTFCLWKLYRFGRKRDAPSRIPRLVIGFFGIVVFLFVIRTITRNMAWANSYTLWETTVKDSPDSSGAWNNLGDAYVGRKEYTKALDAFKRVLSINPEHKGIYGNMGQMYLLMGKPDDAIVTFTQGLSLYPNNVVLINSLATAYQKKGDISKAVELLAKVVEKQPNAESYNQLGYIYLNHSNFTEAISYYQKAIDLDPGNTVSYNNLAISYMTQKRWREAIDVLEKGIAVNPDDEELYFNLGNAYKENGDSVRAAAAFEKSGKLNPNTEDLGDPLQ